MISLKHDSLEQIKKINTEPQDTYNPPLPKLS